MQEEKWKCQRCGEYLELEEIEELQWVSRVWAKGKCPHCGRDSKFDEHTI